jgi:hypothetical protein
MRIELVIAVALLAPKNDCGTSKEATKEVAASVEANGPAVDVSARQLFADYEANEVSADDKYKGKVLRISGTITKIGKDVLDTPYVGLSVGDDVFEVQCMFDDGAAVSSLKKGQKLTVRCKGDGKMGNVIVRGCVVDR